MNFVIVKFVIAAVVQQTLFAIEKDDSCIGVFVTTFYRFGQHLIFSINSLKTELLEHYTILLGFCWKSEF